VSSSSTTAPPFSLSDVAASSSNTPYSSLSLPSPFALLPLLAAIVAVLLSFVATLVYDYSKRLFEPSMRYRQRKLTLPSLLSIGCTAIAMLLIDAPRLPPALALLLLLLPLLLLPMTAFGDSSYESPDVCELRRRRLELGADALLPLIAFSTRRIAFCCARAAFRSS
jgi:hypothetical protein